MISEKYGFDPVLFKAADIPPEIRQFVLRRDNYRCRKCGEEDPENLTIHHVTPRSQSGEHDPDNLVTLCWRCHRRIHDGELAVKRIDNTWYFKELKKR